MFLSTHLDAGPRPSFRGAPPSRSCPLRSGLVLSVLKGAVSFSPRGATRHMAAWLISATAAFTSQHRIRICGQNNSAGPLAGAASPEPTGGAAGSVAVVQTPSVDRPLRPVGPPRAGAASTPKALGRTRGLEIQARSSEAPAFETLTSTTTETGNSGGPAHARSTVVQTRVEGGSGGAAASRGALRDRVRNGGGRGGCWHGGAVDGEVWW